MAKSLLPVVSAEIAGAYKHSFRQDAEGKTAEELETFEREQPFLYQLVEGLGDKNGRDKAASLCLVLTVFSLLRQQAEVDELNQNP